MVCMQIIRPSILKDFRKGLSVLLFAVCIISLSPSSMADNSHMLFINRSTHMLYVLDQNGAIVRKMPCSIGRGGMGKKQNMSDTITPTGDFFVDIVLYKDKTYSAISPLLTKQYSRHPNFGFLKSSDGLSRLFHNMNALDFNRDGKADQSYGTAYIGLDGPGKITGPKLHLFSGTPYWFSIAIHGAPDEARIGIDATGGCIHVAEHDLSWLVTQHIINVGTKVLIRDTNPE